MKLIKNLWLQFWFFTIYGISFIPFVGLFVGDSGYLVTLLYALSTV